MKMVGSQSDDRVEGIQRVVNDQETLNSTPLDSTCLDSSPAGGLTVTTSRAPRTQTPQTPGSPDRRLTRPLSWHKLAVRMNVTLSTVVSAFQSTPRQSRTQSQRLRQFLNDHVTSVVLVTSSNIARHHVNQTSAVSVEQLDTCILLPAFSRVNILSFTSVIAVTTTLVDSRQYLTISLGLSTLSVQFTFKTQSGANTSTGVRTQR